MHLDRSRRGRRIGLVAAVLAGSLCVGTTPAGAVTIPVVGRVSVGNGSTGATGATALSGDGRFVAFTSAGSLVAADTGIGDDVYVRDRVAGTVERASVTNAEAEVGGDSYLCGMSDSGRYVGFTSTAVNLAGGVYPREVYLRDRTAGTTEMVSVSSSEVPANAKSETNCSISDDGRYVAFESHATNLSGNPSGSYQHVYRRDRTSGTTIIVSLSSGSSKGDDASFVPVLSSNGNVVAFFSLAANLVSGDTNAAPDVFVRTMDTGVTERVSLTSAEGQLAGITGSPEISGDGRYVAFLSTAAFVAGDGNTELDAFVRDRTSGNTERVSLGSADQELDASTDRIDLSNDGRYVAFSSDATAVVPGHPAGREGVFLRDRNLGTTVRVSQSAAGTVANAHADYPSVADTGAAVAFTSTATNLTPADSGAGSDAFVRDLALDLAPFASVDALIARQYVDFEGRQPTAGEASPWRPAITGGSSTPEQFIDVLAHGTTWSARRAPVTRLYWSFFTRIPDKGGLDYWVGRYAGGMSLAKIAAVFAQSSEFQNTYGSLTNSAFVTLVYQNIFDRDPDPGGLAFWTGQLDAGTKTRGDVMTNFSESSEGKRVLAPQVDLVLVQLGMLRVMPADPSFTAWVTSLSAGATVIEQYIRGVRVGAAYLARVN